MFKFEKLKETKLSFILPIISLCIIGAITVFSTTYSNEVSDLFSNHLVFYLVGFILFFLISAVNPTRLKSKPVNLLVVTVSIISLFAVLLWGTEIYGAQRWIDLGFFSFQPSEFAKVAIIMFTAFCFGVKTKKENEDIFNIYALSDNSFTTLKKILASEAFIKYLLAFLFYGISVFLIIKQKSLGNSILLTLIFISMLVLNLNIQSRFLILAIPIMVGICISFNVPDLSNLFSVVGFNANIILIVLFVIFLKGIASKLKLNFILLLLFFVGGLLVNPLLQFAYGNVLELYQRQRIESFVGSEDNANLFQNEDFNRQMSILAVGSGRVFGKGLLNGNIVNSRLLPFAYTDFAFAGFAEQFGFIGSIIIITLYLVLLLKIFKIFAKTQDPYYRFICIGGVSLIFFNCAQHIAMNMGITPITGVPLPLISYGGSSILSIFIGLGIINAIDVFGDNDVQVESLKKDYGFTNRS